MALLLAAGVSVGAVALWPATTGIASRIGPTAQVTRGPMVVTLTVPGELFAERRTVISNELRWPVVIKELVSEGTLINQGDTIIKFECKELSDSVIQEQLDLTTAQNDYTQARENLELKRKEMANNIRKAEQAVIDAQEDEKRYIEGDWPVQKNDADSAIQIAQRDLALAEGKLEFKLKVNEDPELNSPYSANEIEAEKLSVARLKLSLEKANSDKDMLLKYNHPRQLRKLKMAVEDAHLELERARLESKTQLLVSEATEQAKKTRLDMQTDKFQELKEEEAKLLVKAERTGLVVYDTGGDSHWRPSEVVVEVGAKISSRQQLMIIPDMSSLQVRVRVYEAMINQVLPELKAYIRLDARPDLALTGQVSRVSVLPDSGSRWASSDVKEYRVFVAFDRPVTDLNLKPGMTSTVELELARLENIVSVPVAAIFTRQGQTFCWRVENGKAVRSEVVLGRSNEKRVEILSGLAEGDTVLIAPPPGEPAQEESAEDESETAGSPPAGEPSPANSPAKGAPRSPGGRPGGKKERPG